jgi:uncharacterized membrane protein YidH (DUF202 family)
MSSRSLLAAVLGIAGACLIVYGLNRYAGYVWAWWRHRGTERSSDIWILAGAVAAGLALMYPLARLLSEKMKNR